MHKKMMLKKIGPIFLVAIFFSLMFFRVELVLEGSEDEEVVKLIVAATKVFSTRAPSRVVIGNPAIADIVDVTNSEISVNAKSPGITTLVFWDAFGEQSMKIKVLAEDVNELKRRVDNLLSKLNLSEVYTKAEEDEGKILILGRIKSPLDTERINTCLGPLKDKTVDLTVIKEEEAVIEIDVQVLELGEDATKTLGFTWPGSVTVATDQTGGATSLSTVVSSPSKWATLFDITKWSRLSFQWTLDALVQEGKARVLSRPRLSCQSGKEAELLVGGEKPIFTTTVAATTGAQGTAVEYKEFGIKLKIKPTVTEEERIKLALNVEVSEVGAAETIGDPNAPTAKAFPLTKRTASTELFINDGQTLAIGGLIKQKTEEDIRKTAGLGDVPFLGALFRKKTTKIGGGQGERGNVELFITLTPTIVSKGISKEKPLSSTKVIADEVVAYPRRSLIPENLSNYISVIQEKITRALYYPAPAKDAGWEGTLKISLNLSANGELKEIKLLQSSGYKILDEAALDIAKKQSPYPPFPPQIDSQELWVDIPVVYKKE